MVRAATLTVQSTEAITTQVWKFIALDIGSWDMDATASKSVAHGSAIGSIIVLGGYIVNDADDDMFPIVMGQDETATTSGIYCTNITATDIVLTRTTSCSYDSTNFNNTAISRGKIMCMVKL